MVSSSSAAISGTIGSGEGDLPPIKWHLTRGDKVHDEPKGLKWWLQDLIEKNENRRKPCQKVEEK
jgi:hypothetical protein